MTSRPLGPNETFITIEIKDVYGKPTVYPVGKDATAFASIAGTKTLTQTTLILVLSLGYSIAEVYRGDVVRVWRPGDRAELHSLCAVVKS